MKKRRVVVIVHFTASLVCFFLLLHFSPLSAALTAVIFPFLIFPGINYLLLKITGVNAINVVADSVFRGNKGD